MMSSDRNISNSRIVGGLILVAAPFLSIGLYACWWSTSIWSEYASMKSWVEVPANIKTTDLEDHSTRKGSRYEVFATYDYEFNNQHYSGDRVTLISGVLMNTGSFNRDAYDELKRHRVDHVPFRCYINPDSPQVSILYRDFPGDPLVYATILATIPGSIGVAFLVVLLATFAPGSESASRSIAPAEPSTPHADSAAHQVESEQAGMRGAMFWTAIGIYWSIASVPLDRKIVESLSNGVSFSACLATVFPLVGILLVAFAFKLFLRSLGFGASIPQLASAPSFIRPTVM